MGCASCDRYTVFNIHIRTRAFLPKEDGVEVMGKFFIHHNATYGLDHAICAMRNPHESWYKGDTEDGYGSQEIGERDLNLAK